MAKGKKYDYRLVPGDTGWAAEITRRKTSKETLVSKRQDGFASESEAKAWAEKELSSFLLSLSKRNKLRSEKSRNKR